MIFINKDTTESKTAAYLLHEWRDGYETPSSKKFADVCKDEKQSTNSLWEWLDTGWERPDTDLIYNKENLRKHLHTEQYGVCCYCVCEVALEKGKSVIEHFEDKGDLTTRCDNIFGYDNLLLSCLGNNQTTEYLVKSGDTLKSIAEKRGFNEGEIIDLNSDKYDKLVPLRTRLKLPKPPYHCDNVKGGFKTYTIEQDGSKTYVIINPTKVDCWNLFEYDAGGNIKGKDDLAIKTIDVLKLDAEPLKEKRKKAWVRAREKFNDKTEYDLSSVENIKKAFEDELKNTYHLCIVHRAYLLNEYPTVLKAYL